MRPGMAGDYVCVAKGALSYSGCDLFQEAVVDKGLDQLLNEAREENPLSEPLPPSESSSL